MGSACVGDGITFPQAGKPIRTSGHPDIRTSESFSMKPTTPTGAMLLSFLTLSESRVVYSSTLEPAMPKRWSVFIDESGSFGPQGQSIVAGILVELPGDALNGTSLRQELEAIWGPGPYPPHATDLRLWGGLVLHGSREKSWKPHHMAEGRYASRIRQQIRFLSQQLDRSPMADRIQEIREGVLPARADLISAERLLGGYEARRALRETRESQRAAMADLVARVFRRLGAGGASVVGAVADQLPPGPAPNHLQVREDAYLRALRVLLERIARLAGEAEVELHILTRDVEVGGLGLSVPLQAHLLRPMLEGVTAKTGSRARLITRGTVLRYRDVPVQGRPLHPMLVLADWIANRMGYIVNSFSGGLGQLERVLVDQRIIPSPDALRRVPHGAASLGALPTLAAAIPEDAVRAAFAGEPTSQVTEGPQWARDQAWEWILASGRWP